VNLGDRNEKPNKQRRALEDTNCTNCVKPWSVFG